MKLLLFVCAVFAVLSAVYGALAIYPADPGHPGHCFSDITGQMNYGEKKSLKDCLSANCNNDGSIQVASCGVIVHPCGLTPVNPSKSYPACCPEPKPCP